MRLAVIVSPNWKDYAQKYLDNCLKSLRSSSYCYFQLFLVDNESTKESLAYLKNLAPEAELIALEKNEGFAGGNNAALKICLDRGFEYVFLLNMDALVEVDCFDKLLAYADAHQEVGALQPRIMMWPEKEKINSLGNSTHFLGFGFCSAYQEIYQKDLHNKIKEISYASGAGVLLRTSALKQVGLFDEKLWMYNEDQDLCLRLSLAGWQNIILPEAVIYHNYEFSRSITKYYWMDRNRIIVLIKNCRALTLLLIAPAFFLMELGHILFSLKSGWFKEKLKVWAFFLFIKNWQYLLLERSRVQSLRKISDRQLTKFFVGKIWYQEIDDFKLRLVNPIFYIYWLVVRSLMFW